MSTALAKIAYEAYMAVAERTATPDFTIWAWESLPQETRDAWDAAAGAVIDAWSAP